MKIIERTDVDYAVNIRFIDNIRNSIKDDILTKDVKITIRDEDFSQYVIEDENNVLLSFQTYEPISKLK
jgi:hypothetical protein